MVRMKWLSSVCLGLLFLAGVAMIAEAQTAPNWAEILKPYPGATLHVIMIGDPWAPAFDQIDPEFEKITGAKVVIDSYGYDATHEKEVLEGSQKSSAYDIVVLDAPWVGEFDEAGYVTDLTPYIAKEDPKLIQYNDFVRVFRDIAKWKGHIVGMPFGAYFMTINYRTDLLKAEGLQPPKTFDDYMKIATVFTNNSKYPTMFGTALNNQQGSPVGQMWFEHIWNFGGKPFKSNYPGSPNPYADMTPMFDSPQGIAVVQYFKDMLKYQPQGALTIAWDDQAQAFASGSVAMIPTWSVREPILIDPNRSSIADKFATTVYPAKKGIKVVPPVGGWVMGIAQYSKQKDLAWDYAKWFTSADVHKKFVVLGGPPSRYSAMKDPEFQSKFPWFKTVAQGADSCYADCRPRIPESFQIINLVGIQVSKALSGQVTPREAMKAANDQIRDLLKQRGYHMSQ